MELVLKSQPFEVSICSPMARDVLTPSIPDMTAENERAFANAGADIDPIEATAEDDLELLSTQISPDVDWDVQVATMKRLMGLINGGLLRNGDAVRRLPLLFPGLSSAICNLRSALVKHSCLVIAQLARELDPTSDAVADYLPALDSQLSHGTRIIAESCRFTLLAIARNSLSGKMLSGVLDLAGRKGAAQRAAAAECLLQIITKWDPSRIRSNWERIAPTLVGLLGDASADVRSFARTAVRALDPSLVETIVSQLNPRTRRAIECEAASTKPRTAKQKKTESPAVLVPRVSSERSTGKLSIIPVGRAPPIKGPDSGRRPKREIVRPVVLPPIEKRLTYVEGQERRFVSQVHDLIKLGKFEEIERDISQIALGFLRSCVDRYSDVARLAFAILRTILPKFPTNFGQALPKLVLMLLNANKANAGIAETILCDLSRTFDANELLLIAVAQKPSLRLLSFVNSVVGSAHLSILSDFTFLIDLAFRLRINEPQKAAFVLRRVDDVGHSSVLQYFDGLQPSEKPEFESLMGCSLAVGEPEREVPCFGSLPFKKFKSAMSGIVSDSRGWISVRSSVMAELGRALVRHSSDGELLRIIETAFTVNQPCELQRVFPALLHCAGNDRLIQIILRDSVLAELFTVLQDGAQSDRRALELVARCIDERQKNIRPDDFHIIFPSLMLALGDQSPEIRQAAVVCFVALRSALGDQSNQFIDGLPVQQQRLISCYSKRAKF
jgi:hypothetical protein